MIKRKDSGFTLIELMIVIAVIGILAVVLIPKVGTVKSQAKESGLDVNVRLVQGYAESKITMWNSNPTVDEARIQVDIVAAFSGTNKSLTNPITAQTPAAPGFGDGTTTAVAAPPLPALVPFASQALYVMDTDDGVAPATNVNLAGTVVVAVDGSGTGFEVNIFAYNEDGVQIVEKAVTVTP